MRNLFLFFVFVFSTFFVMGQTTTSHQKGEPVLGKAGKTSNKIEQAQQSAPADKQSESIKSGNGESTEKNPIRKPEAKLAAPNRLEKASTKQ